MIRYSVIIPHYASLDVLPRAIASVPDRDDIEVLVIDNSQQPIDSTLFKERKNVHILYSPYGKGAGAARNVGLERAQGEWLLLLDADDFFMPDAFKIMDRYTFSYADIVFFQATSCYSDTLEHANRMSDTNQMIYDYINTRDERGLRFGWSSPVGKMIKRELVIKNRILFEQTIYANDVIFSLMTGYYAKTIEAYDKTIYCATVHEGSLTMTPSIQNLSDRIDVFCRYNQIIRSLRIPYPQKSIMYFLYTAFNHYGLLASMKLLFRSIICGNNPFIGISRWFNTMKTMTHENRCN